MKTSEIRAALAAVPEKYFDLVAGILLPDEDLSKPRDVYIDRISEDPALIKRAAELAHRYRPDGPIARDNIGPNHVRPQDAQMLDELNSYAESTLEAAQAEEARKASAAAAAKAEPAEKPPAAPPPAPAQPETDESFLRSIYGGGTFR